MKTLELSAIVCLSISALAAAPLCAEDAATPVPLPSLESDPAGTVAPRTCIVSVTDGKVTVDLSVSTTEERPALLLDGPLFGGTDPPQPYPDRHFPELDIRIDGVPAALGDRFEAFAGTWNITNLLKLAEMDPWAVSRTPPLTSAHPKNAQVLKVLKDQGALDISGDGYLAKWSVRRIVRIALKSVPEQLVELTYNARPGRSSMTVNQLDTTSREKSYCISPNQLKRFTRSGAAPPLLAVAEFAIPTGIDGKPPTSVTITMSPSAHGAASPPNYIYLCGPHGKPIAKNGAVTGERAEVDDSGMVHVLSVAESATPSH